MNAGLIDIWDVFQLETVLTPVDADSGTTASGMAQTFYVDPITGLIVEGIRLYSEIVSSGSYALAATLEIAALGISQNWSDTTLAAITSTLQILDPRLDVLPSGVFRFSFSDLTWDVDGVNVYTHGAGSLDSTELSPAHWPLLGVCAKLSGGATLNGGFPADPPIPTGANSESRTESTLAGGWKKKTGATWVSFPVTLETTPLPVPDGCTCSFVNEPGLSATATDDASIRSLAREYQTSVLFETLVCPCPPGCTQIGSPSYDHYVNTAGFEFAEASVLLVPDFDKAVRRLEDKTGDYRGFWGRYKMPRVVRQRRAQCTIGDDPVGSGTTYPFDGETETHPRQDQTIGVVGSSFHAMEDTLGFQTLAPYARNYQNHTAQSDVYTFVVGSGRCIVGVDCSGAVPCFEDSYSYCLLDTYEGIQGAEADNALPILDTLSTDAGWQQLATYVNTWANPHWSYRYHIEDWDLAGSPTFWVLYWGPIGTQWLYNPALPVPEQRRTRNSIVESPLEASPLAIYQGVRYLGRWLGVSRWYSDEAQAPLSVATSSASSGDWSFTNGSGVFAASVTVTPTNTSVTVDIDIGTFGHVPYMYPSVANRVQVGWTGANITGVSVKMVSADGSSVKEIGTATGTLDLLSGADTKYAGSWARETGFGSISDIGSDDGPNVASGESVTVMADPERQGDFEYLLGFQAAILRLEFTLSSLASFTVDYPTWKRTAVQPYLSRESRLVTDFFYASGPGVRFGNLRYAASVSPPTINDEGNTTTAVDYLCWKRQWFFGVSETGGSPNLATELATIFDSTEGNAVADADADTNAFLMPRGIVPGATKSTLIGAVVNSLREVPPMAMAARKRRNSVYAETGDYCLESWSFAQEPRRFVNPGTLPLVFDDPSGTPWTSVETGWPLGWAVSSHVHPVDNNEGYGYVTKNGTLYGRVRGWWGCFAVVNSLTTTPGANPFNWQDTRGRYKRVDVNADGVEFRGVDWCRPYPGFDRIVQVTATPTDASPRIFEDPMTRRLFVTFTR